MFSRLFDPDVWSAVPFGFWCVVLFILGTVVGSFLNVCIHRLPLGQSIVHPPSHCPHCNYSIPWYLNIPLVTWIYLRAKCRNCGAPISARYFIVELLTGILFLACWVGPGRQSPALALIYAGFLAGLVAASFIDFEHMIVPDEITLGGMAAGFLCSGLAPRLQEARSMSGAMKQSLVGMLAGAAVIYCIVRAGKLVFGRHKIELPADTLITFTETGVQWEGHQVPYEELFYRPSDAIMLQARRVEMADRCYKDVPVRLSVSRLSVGSDEFTPETVPHLEAVSSEIVLPREAMGSGDVKFMGAIGAFLGWKAVLFSLMVSSMIGSVVGVTLIALRKQSSTRLPYIPFLAMAAALWVFCGHRLVALGLALANWLFGVHRLAALGWPMGLG
jgi:leader peptidase (prepilin peptidase)/N-methyltransferase